MSQERTMNGWVYRKVPGGWQKDRPEGPPANPTFPLEAPRMQGQIDNTAAQTIKTGADTVRTRVQTQGDALSNQQAQKDIRQNPISKEDAAIIDRMRQQADVAKKAALELKQAAAAVDRFRTGPDRAKSVSRSIVAEDDGLIEQGMRNAYGFVAGIDAQDQEDYQNLDRLRQARVATIQLEQKGLQTESDAARYIKSTFGPEKMQGVNAAALGEAVFRAEMDARRPQLYTAWANKFGSLSALNKAGKSVDDWWNDTLEAGWQKYQQKRTEPQGGVQFLGWDD